MNHTSELKQVSRQPLDAGATDRGKAPTAATSARDARLRKHADYQRVYGASRKQSSPSMSWFLARRDAAAAAYAPGDGPRVGLTAGKVLGKAHERNRIKRRMRAVVRKHLNELPRNVDLILHPRRTVMTMDFGKLDAEVLRIFRQAAAQASTSAFGPAPRPVPRNAS